MNDKVFVHITWVSIRKCVGFSSCILASKHFLITSSLLGLTWVSNAHHAIATFVTSIVRPSILRFWTYSDHKGMLEWVVILHLSTWIGPKICHNLKNKVQVLESKWKVFASIWFFFQAPQYWCSEHIYWLIEFIFIIIKIIPNPQKRGILLGYFFKSKWYDTIFFKSLEGG
jgi:hypothetical protein